MRFGRILLSSAILLSTTLPVLAMTHARRGPTSPKLFNKKATKASIKKASHNGIDSGRATEIQAALIKSGYLAGQPTGSWDTASQTAMQKLQADNGWQTKLVPDARAIIKLGLGPAQDAAPADASPLSID